jgi:phosphohistidine phosphatase
VKTLILLRHAKSASDDDRLTDHDRPLAARGERACEQMGRWLSASSDLPELAICSSARRAVDTLERILPHLPTRPAVRIERSLYLAAPKALLETVTGVEDRFATLLIVGHNPGMHALATDLAGDGDPQLLKLLAQKFPPAALAALRFPVEHWHDVRLEAGELTHFVTPRSLEHSR